MNTITKSLFAVFTIALFVGVSQSHAQNNAGPGVVAVLDVAKVFKDNQFFDSKMKEIKGAADQLRADITQQQENIKTRAQELANYEVGTPDRDQREAALAQEQTALGLKAKRNEAELLNREARIYHDLYLEMQSVVSQIASEYNIALVLRFDSGEINPDNRADVIKGVNRPVVFHRRLDLTAMVSEKLNARMAQAGGNPNLK